MKKKTLSLQKSLLLFYESRAKKIRVADRCATNPLRLFFGSPSRVAGVTLLVMGTGKVTCHKNLYDFFYMARR